MRAFFIFFIFNLLLISSFAQDRTRTRTGLNVFFKEFNLDMKVRLNDTLQFQKDSFIYKIFFESALGKASFQCYGLNNKLIAKGNYNNSLGVLSEYRLATYANSNKKSYYIYSYYQPLMNGIWVFYNEKVDKYIKKTYDEGIEIN